MTDTTADNPIHASAFAPGQIVLHQRFGYRGVIFDVDPVFMGSEEWYEAVARSRPPKDKPWYHVLVDGQPITTYVAERHLSIDPEPAPVEHPYIDSFFRGFADGGYQPRQRVS
jgi:heat shock protein HspQ